MAQDDPKLNFTGRNSDLAARWQAGVPDANGHPPKRHVSATATDPCRHCFGEIAGGETAAGETAELRLRLAPRGPVGETARGETARGSAGGFTAGGALPDLVLRGPIAQLHAWHHAIETTVAP